MMNRDESPSVFVEIALGMMFAIIFVAAISVASFLYSYFFDVSGFINE